MSTKDESDVPESTSAATPDVEDSFGQPGAAAGEATKEGSDQRDVCCWEQLPDEDDRAYAAAAAFFESGPTRDASALPRMGEWTLAAIKGWRERYGWDERARLYDAHRESMDREGEGMTTKDEPSTPDDGAAGRGPLTHRSEAEKLWNERRAAIRDREWKASELMQKLAERILESQIDCPDVDYTARDAVILIEKASDLARRAAEMPIRVPPPKSDATRRSSPPGAGETAASGAGE